MKSIEKSTSSVTSRPRKNDIHRRCSRNGRDQSLPDEDVHSFIAEALRLRGWQALTTRQAGNQRASDIDQVTYATQNGYSILTYNVTDFPRLHNEILASGGTHAGIIVATQERPSVNARTLLSLLGAFDAEDLVDQLIYLNNWMND